jgi:hypothetical protein
MLHKNDWSLLPNYETVQRGTKQSIGALNDRSVIVSMLLDITFQHKTCGKDLI